MSEEQRQHPPLWAELRRHPAFQTAIIFAGASWLALQAADIFGLETGTVRAIGVLLVTIFVLLVGYALLAVVRDGAAHAVVTRGRTRTIGIVTTALVVLGTGAWLARPYLVPPVRPGAEVIAVLPFNATGAGVDVLGEGLVDLLSTNLNEVGLIRTINPRTTLHQFNEVARGGSIDLAGQLRVGRNVGAGSILVGSLVSTGNEVRITAELYSVESGTVIAQAQENGQPDNVLALVDQLSIQLMQDIWRSRAPMPELRVSAITTQSVPAIRAYMRGEQFYRRVQWDSAMAAFEEAVRHDSTFALAHFRLGETYGWSENLGSELAREHSDKAARFADRLPARERTLIVAHQLHEKGDVAAIDSLQAYVARFPDDVGGHYLLADARTHAGAVLGLDLETMLAGHERVHEMDPTFAPNYAHLLELTTLEGDSASFDRYLAAFRNLVPDEAGAYEIVRDIRWGDRETALATIGDALRGADARRPQLIARIMTSAGARGFATNADPGFLLAAIDSLERAASDVPQVRNQAVQSRTGLLGGTGRFREAEETVAALRSESADLALNAAIFPIVVGLAPLDALVQERELLARAADRPPAAYWLAMEALTRSDADAAERHIATIVRDTARRSFIQPQMITALEGWATAVRGDTAAGIRALRGALLDLGYAPSVTGTTTPLRVQLALMQLTRDQSRAEGIRRLELAAAQDGGMLAHLAIPLAEAYLAEGRIADARSMYARFISLWHDADPDLQPRVQAAENALQRITGERGVT